jgi:hypothetical protein
VTVGGHLVLFGGQAEHDSYGDTWILRRHGWQRIHLDSPTGRYRAGSTAFPSGDRAVVFGGFHMVDDRWTQLDDTWQLSSTDLRAAGEL